MRPSTRMRRAHNARTNVIHPRGREVFEMACASSLLMATVAFAFVFIPGKPYLAAVTLPWIGLATHLIRLGHSRRMRRG